MKFNPQFKCEQLAMLHTHFTGCLHLPDTFVDGALWLLREVRR
jgi:hypothetical protein